jgi:hypothetical protein
MSELNEDKIIFQPYQKIRKYCEDLVEENLLIDEESCDVVDHDHDHVHTSSCGCGLKNEVLAIKSSVEAIGKEQTIEKMVQAYMLQKKYDPRVND